MGSLPELRRDPLHFLQALAREYGDMAHFKAGSRHVFQVNHPDSIQDILVTKNRCFHKTGLIHQARPILGNGLLTSEGDFHTRQRRMIQPALKPQRVGAYGSIVTDYTQQMCEHWREGQEINLFQEMLEVTLKIISRALFDFNAEAEAAELEEAVNVAIEYFDRLLSPKTTLLAKLPTSRNRRFRAAQRTLNEFVFRMIEHCRNGHCNSNNLLSKLVNARDTEGNGQGMSDRQVRDEFLTLLTAGHETIATALTWTFFLLSRNPDAESRLHAELDCVLNGRIPTADDAGQLEYTRMVLAEAMRLYPPLWALSRKAVVECEIGGYPIPQGAIVGVSQYVMHRDSRYFERPNEFDPTRWEEAAAKSRPKYSYFPFGGGPRLCIGEPFAWMEATLLLTTVCQYWKPVVPAGYRPELQPLITLRPKGGLPVRLEMRGARQRTAAADAAAGAMK